LRIEFIWPAVVLLCLSILTMSIRWTILLKGLGVVQGTAQSWRYYMIGGFYGMMLPGIIGGDVVRLALSFKAHRKEKALLASSVVFERTCGFIGMTLIAAFAAFSVPTLLEGGKAIVNLILLLCFASVSCFAFFFVILKAGPSSWFQFASGQGGLKEEVGFLIQNFRHLPLTNLSLLLLLSTQAHVFDIIGTFCIAKSLHIEHSIYLFLLVMPVVYVLTMIPISLGGLGVREGVLTFFLLKVGIPASDSLILGFLIFSNRVFMGLVGGFVQFMVKDRYSRVV
jgi:uncharacterized protein (TIRG00374 family)